MSEERRPDGVIDLEPHGLLGQGLTGPVRNGKVDVHPAEGEYTTQPWAEGAIESEPSAYETPLRRASSSSVR